MKFPRLVFRSPGPDQCQGGTYASTCVTDQAQFDAAIGSGWHATLPDALNPPVIETKTYSDGTVATGPAPLPDESPAPQGAAIVTPADDTPPTRDELKAQAKVLGIIYPHNVPTIKLAEMIEQAMAPKV